MRITNALRLATILLAPALAHASETAHGHEDTLFHRMQLEVDSGLSRGDQLSRWDLDGWLGGDDEKLWLRSEGHLDGSTTEEAEVWALYSRNIATYWDVQLGVRYDWEPQDTAYFVAGVAGLAPYYFETEAHFFVSDAGDLSARLRQENDLLLTQRLITQPYAELELQAQDVPELNLGAGLSHAQLGLQTRYELTREFAPYLDFSYERKFGQTGRIAEAISGDKGAFIGALGLRLMF